MGNRRRKKKSFAKRYSFARRSGHSGKRRSAVKTNAGIRHAFVSQKASEGQSKDTKRRKLTVKIKLLLALLIIAVVFVYSLMLIENTMKPSLNSAAEIKTKEFIEKIVMNAVYTVTEINEKSADLSGNTEDLSFAGTGDNDIIKIRETEAGSISFVSLNTALLNKIGTRIAKIVNEGVSENSAQSVRISMGSLLGSKLLSQFTPNLKFDIIPVAVSDVSYKTEFESVGINQTKYKVYMNVNTEAKVLVPFMPDRISTESTVLIAEAVIVGDVPDTYANIPQDSMSDFVS